MVPELMSSVLGMFPESYRTVTRASTVRVMQLVDPVERESFLLRLLGALLFAALDTPAHALLEPLEERSVVDAAFFQTLEGALDGALTQRRTNDGNVHGSFTSIRHHRSNDGIRSGFHIGILNPRVRDRSARIHFRNLQIRAGELWIGAALGAGYRRAFLLIERPLARFPLGARVSPLFARRGARPATRVTVLGHDERPRRGTTEAQQ